MYIALYCILGIIAVLIAIILIRTMNFKPKSEEKRDIDIIKLDENKIVSDLQTMVRVKTVSDTDKSKEDASEFSRFPQVFEQLFPNIKENLEKISVEGRALLYKWKGKSSENPTVLMAHYDVVSVIENQWEKPPFEGVLENGVLWGRGTLDTKGTLNGAAQAVEHLLKQGFVPENDLYLAFGGDEEINGDGAPSIVRYFKKNGINPQLVVDEGGAVVEDVFPGVKQSCAVIGIAEKGMLNLKFVIDGKGGHASAPPRHTLVGKLSQACVKVENKPFKFQLTKPALEMFDTLGRRSSFVYRMIFANLWCFKGILNSISKKSGGELNALMRTTVAFTQMQGSKGMNVMPSHVEMLANLRLVGSDTMDSAIEYIQNIVGEDVKLEKVGGMNPSRISETNCEAFEKVKKAVGSTWTEALVSPYLMVACSDSRHYGEISDKVYRFSAMHMTKAERASIHGNNEKVLIENVVKAVEFYVRLIKQV